MTSSVNPAAAVNVLVVDDSPLMRRITTQLLESDPHIHIVGTAADGLEAIEKVAALHPDVVTLDIEMPRLDGLGALREIMARMPLPVIMLSALSDAEMVMQALQAGAVEFVAKPSGTVSIDLYKVREELIHKVRLATFSRPSALRRAAPAPDPAPVTHAISAGKVVYVAIGASTGGPSAIGEVVRGLSADLPVSVFIAQHMPAGFTKSFAERLHRSSGLVVAEASDGLQVRPQCAYVAPGDAHMVLEQETSRVVVRLLHTPPVNGVLPSIDVLMKSVAEVGGADVVGVLLTGMGTDGAAGLSQIKEAGGWTIAQDRDTSTIYGMPRAAIRLGVVDEVAPVTEIAALVANAVWKRAARDD